MEAKWAVLDLKEFARPTGRPQAPRSEAEGTAPRKAKMVGDDRLELPTSSV